MGPLGHILFGCFDAVLLTICAAMWWEIFHQWRQRRRDRLERRSPPVTITVDWSNLQAWGHLALVDDLHAAIAATMAVPAELLIGHQPPETDAILAALWNPRDLTPMPPLARFPAVPPRRLSLAELGFSENSGFIGVEYNQRSRIGGGTFQAVFREVFMGYGGRSPATIRIDVHPSEGQTIQSIMMRGEPIDLRTMQLLVANALSVDIDVPAQVDPFLNGFGAMHAGFFGEEQQRATRAAREKSIALLKEWLTPVQRNQYDREDSFNVIGGDTGKRYRLMPPMPYNIIELDADGREVSRWCMMPKGTGAAGDVLLAQKVALEKRETETLRIANKRELPTYFRCRLQPDAALRDWWS